MEYTVIRSKRKTIALQVTRDGQVVVRAPLRMSSARIKDFVNRNSAWIEKKQGEWALVREKQHIITEQERAEGIAAAKQYIPQRAAFYAERMGVTYGRICIREQKTRWGSCSSKGHLNFNWKLMLMPGDVLDYVVVHELAHRKEMNHSPKFWAVVEKELPDYRQLRDKLKKYGETLMTESG
ncbi:MAG: SprT family zinc-dependent metalloprotease [Lachnospiraceae bacterium]|nr:SprT family zinc-dependent metalloprotease [Lachnospiraceae bacterium]